MVQVINLNTNKVFCVIEWFKVPRHIAKLRKMHICFPVKIKLINK